MAKLLKKSQKISAAGGSLEGLVNLFISRRADWGDDRHMPKSPQMPALCMRGGDVAGCTAGSVRFYWPFQPRGSGKWLADSKRSAVAEFSYQSRRRFRESVELLDWSFRRELWGWSFLTLTYPRHFCSARDSKRHMQIFNKRLRRAYPGALAVWCLERQQRGAPHYHLLVWWGDAELRGARSSWALQRGIWERRREWVSAAWAVVVGEGTPDAVHVSAGTRLEPVRTIRRLRDYMAKRESKALDTARLKNEFVKRVQKGGENWENQGRWWGIVGGAVFARKARFAVVQFSRRSIRDVRDTLRAIWLRRLNLEESDLQLFPVWTDGGEVDDVLAAAGVSWTDFSRRGG